MTLSTQVPSQSWLISTDKPRTKTTMHTPDIRQIMPSLSTICSAGVRGRKELNRSSRSHKHTRREMAVDLDGSAIPGPASATGVLPRMRLFFLLSYFIVLLSTIHDGHRNQRLQKWLLESP